MYLPTLFYSGDIFRNAITSDEISISDLNCMHIIHPKQKGRYKIAVLHI